MDATELLNAKEGTIVHYHWPENSWNLVATVHRKSADEIELISLSDSSNHTSYPTMAPGDLWGTIDLQWCERYAKYVDPI